ncbi:MAG: hypothetical protein IJ274_07425, partial [Lachnospiraceae bacterium]|nr:hypothetical protein [Lachnospiraceae bacterium]
QEGLPYVYSVAAQNSKYVGAYDMEGLLVKEDIESPVLTGAAIDNSFVLQWKSIKGADAYSVYRMDDGGKWELIAEQITELSYTEISKDESCLYKVSAVISNGEQVYEYDSNELKLEKEER